MMGVQHLALTYADDGGTSHALRLKPKNTAAFINALDASSARSSMMIPAVNVVPEEPTPTLSVALKKYWSHLLVVGLFPTIFFVGGGTFHLPFGVFVPVFFAVMIYGAWPSITKRVPYTYKIIIGAVWMGGGILGVAVASLISLLFRSHHP